MLNHNDAAMVAAIRTLQESLTNEEYTVIMDEAVSLVESGVTANNADAIKFIASKHLDEASYAIVEAVMNEAILNEGLFNSPLRSHLAKLKEIKDAKPKDYDGPEATKKFVNRYYDDIVKAARILEKEPNELQSNEVKALVGYFLSFIGGYAASGVGALTGSAALVSGGIAAMMLGIIFAIVYSICAYYRQRHDREGADQLAKIRRALKKVDPKKLPEAQRHKLDDCLEAIDDAETAISARIKVANESTSIMGAIWGEPIDEAARVQKRINMGG